MKILSYLFCIVLFITSCSSSDNKQENASNHKVTVKEVLQAGSYTYLHVDENGSDVWLAVTKMNAQVGETYYYEGGMTMKNFESKGLERTFEEILFLDKISKDPTSTASKTMDKLMNDDMLSQHHSTKLKTNKQEIKVDPIAGSTSIGEIYANKEKYDGKKITVRGQVTKFNEAIMNTNWIHIQDGTESEGKFDLTLKSDAVVKVGDIVTLEATVTIDQDLGHGYEYEILMEDAVIK